tara:strand:- start:3791 stop:3931 length:141 start_codon:yes stop_codon:yes gene_type:complete
MAKKITTVNLEEETIEKLKNIGKDIFGSTNVSGTITYLTNNYKLKK